MLKDFTTIGIGGLADVLYLRDESSLEALFCTPLERPYFVLGSGSNLLVKDGDLKSLCLKMEISGTSWEYTDEGHLVTAGAGLVFDDLLAQAAKLSLPHGQVLSGIPGTVGAAPVQNIGAYGDEVSSYIRSVRAFDTREKKWVSLTKHECHFGYRSSIFNTTHKSRYIITTVTFFFPNGEALVEHPEVVAAMDGLSSSHFVPPSQAEKLREKVLAIRHQKGMLSGSRYPKSAGSFFKNSFIDPDLYHELLQIYSQMPGYVEEVDQHKLIKVPTAWLIAQTPFVKGFKLKSVGVSPYHNLSLINLGDGNYAELMELASEIQESVREKFKILIMIEPERIEV